VLRVGLLVFPGVQSLDLSGPMDVFAEANRFLPAAAHYALTVVGTEAGPFACSSGLQLVPQVSYQQIPAPDFDLLLVTGGPELPQRPPDARLSAWLQLASRRAQRFGSICNGAFLLGHAGLLDGCTVTTHWSDAAHLAQAFPLAQVDFDRIYVKHQRLYTSAGVTAGIDLSLFLVAEDHGQDVALNAAKRLVVFMQRSGGQSQFSPYLTPHMADNSPVAVCRQYVQDHIGDDLSVEVLAREVAMSPRHFARVFVREARVTPAEFVTRARVDAARVKLENSAAPLKTVAFECGFGNADQMRGAFMRYVGVSAKQYRENFFVAATTAATA
jgi:transcriptional regulator GlxA family with amidase domain